MLLLNVTQSKIFDLLLINKESCRNLKTTVAKKFIKKNILENNLTKSVSKTIQLAWKRNNVPSYKEGRPQKFTEEAGDDL